MISRCRVVCEGRRLRLRYNLEIVVVSGGFEAESTSRFLLLDTISLFGAKERVGYTPPVRAENLMFLRPLELGDERAAWHAHGVLALEDFPFLFDFEIGG